MAAWVSVCRVDELLAGRGRTCEAAGLLIAVFPRGDSIVALLDRCPHEGGSLGSGWVEEDEVVCPLHRWRFKLQDGRCTTMRGSGVHRFPTEVREGRVWVLV
jgi:nitrite reductase/ring-hydroxylating ferredoxin subunit